MIHIPKRFYYYTAFTVLSIGYIVISLLAPQGPNRFDLTPTKTRLLELTIYIPVVIIWAIAVYGAVHFKIYTDSIKKYKDGQALDKISTGLLVLTGAIIINTLIGVVRPWALKDHWLSAYTIFANYVDVILPLIAFIFMYVGSVELLKLIKNRPKGYRRTAITTAAIIVIAVAYILALFTYHYRNVTPNPNKFSSFYISDPLILLTLAIPYLIGWGLGIKAAYNLDTYRQKVKGVIYRSSMRRVVTGTLIVVFFYIIVQLLVAFSTYFSSANLSSILMVLYLLVLLYAIGFVVIAFGAKRLSRIEKVR